MIKNERLKNVLSGIKFKYGIKTQAEIAAALGHSIGNPTTSIYIDFNQAKVDEANRRVLDYVFGQK